MKKFATFFFLTLLVQQVDATTFYHQLCAFNENWKKYTAHVPAEKARIFKTDQAYVQAHLSTVIPILRSNPTWHLSKNQYQTRLQLIEVLNQYRSMGKFPINYHHQQRIPVFIDQHDTHCAVGYLLKETGYGKVAKEIAATNNFAWLKNIKHPQLLKWQEYSGLSVEELKLIQGAYDFYMPNALMLANKYEVPQKPEVMTLYFDSDQKKSNKEQVQYVWCYGEGEDGVLDGLWVQNFAKGISWIQGYYKNGKRTGKWKEYYQGTNQLCRTEHWKNDQLNGVRTRFDRSGKIIEEINFKNGNAVAKTNYDFEQSLKYIRRPIDGTLVNTEVYTIDGTFIACGKERIFNPGNLLWFQNIELTALNSVAITSRSKSIANSKVGNQNIQIGTPVNLYSNPPLVQYTKEGKWFYYGKSSFNKLARLEVHAIKHQKNRNPVVRIDAHHDVEHVVIPWKEEDPVLGFSARMLP